MIDSGAEGGASSSDMMSSTSDRNTTYRGTRGLLNQRSCPSHSNSALIIFIRTQIIIRVSIEQG